MDRAAVEKDVVLTLRQCALRGSDREVALDKPLGQLGLGLDSLALLQFVMAVEQHFATTLSDDLWTRRGQLTLRDVVDEIVSLETPVVSIARSGEGTPGEVSQRPGESSSGHAVKALAKISEQGLLRGSMTVARRAFSLLAGPIYRHEEMTIMSGSLVDLPTADLVCQLPLEFRVARDQRDLGSLDGFWKPRLLQKNLKILQDRFERGYTCLTARHEGQVVAMDWVSAEGDDEALSGLRINVRPGACYGLDLVEHRLYQGKGVGLALLVFSLGECQRRGYQVQVALVNAGNLKSISALTTFFGFKSVGKILTERVLGKPFSRWVLGQQSGRGEILLP